MPKLSSSEKQKRYRERKKATDESFAAAERLRGKRRRSTATLEQKLHTNEQSKIRKRKFRERKRLCAGSAANLLANQNIENEEQVAIGPNQSASLNDASSSQELDDPVPGTSSDTIASSQNSASSSSPCIFRSKQSLGKVMKRVVSAMPKSPRKQVLIMEKLLNKHGIKLQNSKAQRVSGRKFDQLTVEKVYDFYERDDVSRQLAGKKDTCKTTNREGKPDRLPKRLLQFNLKDTYNVYKNLYQDEEHVGISKFCALRPKHVQLAKQKHHNVCCCPKCENIGLIFQQIQWSQTLTDIPRDINQLIEKFVCDTNNSLCMKRLCHTCSLEENMQAILDDLISENMSNVDYNQWKGGNLVTEADSSRLEIRDKLLEKLGPYITHIYKMKVQFKAICRHKELLKPNEILLQIDYAQNYNIKAQNEVMAAHWEHNTDTPVTILTGVAYYKDSEELTHQSYAVVSNTSVHGSLETQVFCESIFNHIKDSLDITIKKVIFWTDGASAHFKNSKTMAAISCYTRIFKFPATWNFTESYHGKGPHDGIGGLLKHQVWRAVLKGTTVVRNAEEFFTAAKNVSKKVAILYVSKGQIEARRPYYENIWSGIKQAKGILNCRCVKPVTYYQLALYGSSIESDAEDPSYVNITPGSQGTFENAHLTSDEEDEEMASLLMDYNSSTEDLDESESHVESSINITNDSVDAHEDEDVDEFAIPNEPTCKARAGDYLLVKYNVNKKYTYYVGCVQSSIGAVHEGGLHVKFLSHQHTDVITNDYIFKYVNDRDEDYIDPNQIVEYLDEPLLKRRDAYVWQGKTFPPQTL